MPSMKEAQEKLVKTMKSWQQIENASVASTGKIIEMTKNPLIRQVMEIIQADSQRHYHIQQMIVDSFEQQSLNVTPDELVEIWDSIEGHIALERRTVDLANEALESLKNSRNVVAQYLVEYLLEDENKHNKILDNLESIKKGMYTSG
jgi:hypothetical protein